MSNHSNKPLEFPGFLIIPLVIACVLIGIGIGVLASSWGVGLVSVGLGIVAGIATPLLLEYYQLIEITS